ncbi:MAG: hypothetical protein CME32_31625 [Gimesia sp.]|nr:hypothetical protein [Gimesia sp.]
MGDTFVDGTASAWIGYSNNLDSAYSSYSSAIDTAASNWDTGFIANVDNFVSAIDSAISGYEGTVDSAATDYVSGSLGAFISYIGQMDDAITSYSTAIDDAFDKWKQTSIAAGKAYIGSVAAAWTSYYDTVVPAAIDAKNQIYDAILAYQDWYENEPSPHGYSGTDADGDGIYEIPGGPDLVPGKQHELAVTVATSLKTLNITYADAMYTYQVTEKDAWLTFKTDTINADKEYDIAVTNAQKDYSIKTSIAGNQLDDTLLALEAGLSNSKTNASADYAIALSSAAQGFISTQVQLDSSLTIAENNANAGLDQAQQSEWTGFVNASTTAWFAKQRENTNLTTSEYSETYEKEQWINTTSSALNAFDNAASNIIIGLENTVSGILAGGMSSLTSALNTFNQSTTNAGRTFDIGLTNSNTTLWTSYLSADNDYGNARTQNDATRKNAITAIDASLKIGIANVIAARDKHNAQIARQERIQTALDHLDEVTNNTSSSDYYLDGSNYQDAFEFVPEGYYWEAGLYVNDGTPPGSIIEKVQNWVDGLENGSSSSGYSSGSGFSSGSGSGSSSSSSSSSGSSSTSGSSSGSTSGSGSSNSSASSSASGSTSASGSSSSSGSTSNSETESSSGGAFFSVPDDYHDNQRTYVEKVGQVFKGYGDSIYDTATGTWYMFRHPIETAKGLGNAVMHPVDTATAIKNDIVEKSETLRGQGNITGSVLQTLVPGFGATKLKKFIPKKTSKMSQVANGKGSKLLETTTKKPDASAGSLKKPTDGQLDGVADKLDNAKKKPYSNPKNRPKYGDGQVEEVWKNAKGSDGKVIDPDTKEIIEWEPGLPRDGVWDMSHLPGHEFRKLHKRYMDGDITKEQFLEEYRNPARYRPETPTTNRSHKLEEP